MDTPKAISFMYEATVRCNHACVFCYNTWKASGGTGRRELDTKGSLELLARVMDATDDCDVALSGGEPLLREDICELVSFIKKKGRKVIIVTNGTLLDEEMIDRCVSCGTDAFQISLLGDSGGLHDGLVGAKSFERVIDAVLGIRKRGGRVFTFFAGLAGNVEAFRRTLELNLMLGVEHVAFGRFTPGGAGLVGWESLMPSPGMIRDVLDTGEAFCRKYRLSLSVSTPVLPCLVDVGRYERIKFGFCAVGNPDRSILGIDAEGNLKPCSHSAVVLGNLLESPLGKLLEHEHLKEFVETVPEFCRDCPDLSVCRGGCRSSAHACYGSLRGEDPFLAMWKAQAKKPPRPSFDSLRSRVVAGD